MTTKICGERVRLETDIAIITFGPCTLPPHREGAHLCNYVTWRDTVPDNESAYEDAPLETIDAYASSKS